MTRSRTFVSVVAVTNGPSTPDLTGWHPASLGVPSAEMANNSVSEAGSAPTESRPLTANAYEKERSRAHCA